MRGFFLTAPAADGPARDRFKPLPPSPEPLVPQGQAEQGRERDQPERQPVGQEPRVDAAPEPSSKFRARLPSQVPVDQASS